MCFSPTASFTVSAATALTGLFTLRHVEKKQEVALALVPLFFSVQQCLEGLLWLTLPQSPQLPRETFFTQAFLFFALVFWPLYAPYTVFILEAKGARRKLIGLCLACGLGVACYFSLSLTLWPRTAGLLEDHIVYSADPNLPKLLLILYPAATCLSFMLSSHHVVRFLGILLYVGSLVSFYIYWNSFTSVWCFFAASASIFIFWHFKYYGVAKKLIPNEI